MLFGDTVMVTAAAIEGLSVMIMMFEVAGLFVAHDKLDVITQDTVSPSEIVVVM
jgi:hypothetical protein